MIKVIAFLPDNSSKILTSLDELAEVWSHDEARVWLDMEEPSEEDLRRVGEIFGLDYDALDDCLHGEQQPRIDEFEHYIFLVLYGLYGLKEQEELDPHKLAAFCGSRFLITVHRHPLLSVRQVRARCGRHPEVFTHGLDLVLYTIIDLMVDNYVLVADRFEETLEDLEDVSFDPQVDETVVSEAADIRQELVELRRLAAGQRHLLLPVAKGEYDFVSETLSQRFSHVCDHLSQVIDMVDSMRETVVSIRDNYHAALTQRTNEIMRVLTVFAAVMLPLTLMAGIYGMNLPVWPSGERPASFWGVLGAMSALAAALLWYFRRRKWV